jgi:hypothetical protein
MKTSDKAMLFGIVVGFGAILALPLLRKKNARKSRRTFQTIRGNVILMPTGSA